MTPRNKMQKMARDAVSKAAMAVDQANKALSEAQAALKMMEELSADDLDGVAGGYDRAVNPFEELPRVPEGEIDPELRGEA